jgi:hypothetical protein
MKYILVKNYKKGNRFKKKQPQMNAREIVRGLPSELVRYIISFTYSCQSPELLEDIRSFYSDRNIVQDFYYNKFMHRFHWTENEDHDWMANDIIIYANADLATMNGYHDHFFDICSRFFSLDSQEKQRRFIDGLLHPHVKPMRLFTPFLI